MVRKYGYTLCLALIFCLIAACGGNGVSTVSNNSNNTEADTGISDDTSTKDDTGETKDDTGETKDDASTNPGLCELVDCIEHSSCDPETGLCVCIEGYDMGEDAEGVARCVDQCETMRCGANTIGCEAGACICAEGYENDGGLGCKKIADEEACVDLPGSCQEHATCDSESGKCVCDAGYDPNDENTECIDRCVTMRCGANTTCEAGQCLCAEGFEKVDDQCVPIKAEVCGNAVCPEYSHCEQDQNKCVCDFGEKDGLGGIDDQRLTCKTPCDAIRCNTNSTCDTDSQQCECDPGYIMVEGQGCQQI